jgi:hypothetical protein
MVGQQYGVLPSNLLRVHDEVMSWEVNQLCAMKYDRVMQDRERVRDARLVVMLARVLILWQLKGGEMDADDLASVLNG